MRSIFAFLLAAAAASRADALSVRIEQPVSAASLRGGSTAVIAWSADDLGPDVEEWEAFLSVDGGHYYAARITPHLDVSIHQFRFTVPNVATRDARILLRFGNERNERIVETPLTISIDPAPETHDAVAIADHNGESARPGDPGVASWVESGRDGRNAVPMQSSRTDIHATLAPSGEHEVSPLPGHAHIIARPFDAVAILTARRNVARLAAADTATDALLQTCRLNI